jgi:PLP dependent protein
VLGARQPVLAAAPPADVVATRAGHLRRRIADAGRDPHDVRIVAVTKGFGPDAVVAACAAGLFDIGENYAQELLDKVDAIGASAWAESESIRWHYLGAVQRRRVARLAPVVSCWQTVCRPEEGQAIASRAPGAAVFVEVNVTGIAGRNGAAPAAVPAVVDALRACGLDVRGLMVVGPPEAGEQSRPGFRVAARLAAELGLHELSMGMTDDLEVALSEGSTMVRVGRALFGERPQRAS